MDPIEALPEAEPKRDYRDRKILSGAEKQTHSEVRGLGRDFRPPEQRYCLDFAQALQLCVERKV